MRVLITGTGGQLGHDLVAAFGEHDVVATDHRSLDITDRDAVMQAITGTSPDVVVNAAAWTAVDACEGDPDRAYLTNALAVRFVADAARRVGAHLCHVSTDYVFDGTKDGPYVEWDPTNPTSVYGRSKLGGELEVGPDATVVRTSWVCGEHGANMVKTVLRLIGEHETLSFVDDQVGHPSFTEDLARMIHLLVTWRLPGTYHVTNQRAVSWYEFVREIAESAGEDPDRVRPIATADLDPPRPAPRPANSVLDNAALRLQGIPLLPDFREPLDRLVSTLRS